MFGLGLSEIIFLAILALVVVGPKQLPEVARTLGRFLNELRRTTNIMTDDLKSHMHFDPIDLNTPPQNAETPPVPHAVIGEETVAEQKVEQKPVQKGET